jgi:hypothetical protein
MTKWEFQQIVQRDQAVQLRNENTIGIDWLKPILDIEAEADRHALILFCGDLSQKLRKAHEQNHH